MHLHTSESSPCAKTNAINTIKAFKENGYDAVVVTDHLYHNIYKDYADWKSIINNFLKGYNIIKEEAKNLGIKVYLGVEIRFPQSYNDYLVYGIDEEFLYNHEYIYNTSIEEFYELVKDKYIIVQAHPYRWGSTLYNPKYLHGVEILNTNPNNDSKNHLAYEAWLKTDLISTCGCDFHREDCITNSAYMTFDKLPCDNNELVELLRKKEYEIIKTCD